MGRFKFPDDVALIAAVMAVDRSWLDRAKQSLSEAFGPIARESALYPFDMHSSYYEKEMGTGLIKQFVSFERRIPMDRLPAVKIATNKLEQRFARREEERLGRRVNVDPGYMAPSKLVLATTKNYDHRIYLGQGIFADLTLRYCHGRFETLDWTYPDYRTDLAQKFFAEVRNDLLGRRSESSLS